jgi:type IV pilus assembly protein PilB
MDANTKCFPAPQNSPDPPRREPPPGLGQIVTFLLQEGVLPQKQLEYAVRIRSKLEAPRPLLEVLKDLKYIVDDQINQAIRTHREDLRLDTLLLELGLIREEDLDSARKIRAEENSRRNLREILTAHHLLAESKIIDALCQRLGFPYIEPEFSKIDRQLFSRAPIEIYEKHNAVPIRADGKEIVIAFSDPLDLLSLAEFKKFFGDKIQPAVAILESIQSTIKQSKEKSPARHFTPADDESVVHIVDSLILAAVQEGDISDIHIEPMSDRLRVRFRQDGVLVNFRDYPAEIIPALSTRLKVMCKADIAEKRRHQGGRLFFEQNGRKLDIRISFYAAIHGENIVMRLLNRMSSSLNLGDVGMSPRMLKRFREDVLDRPSGIMIITGPTGSGKTTTVYSCINYIKNPQTSIITAEDPVEYIIDGITQCSINPAINLTYEETLRHIVRQDPDVIVIGEIRDAFSAQVAVQAALTGHKVLTTFHTEDSIGGLVRLLNLDIEAFLISSTVVCVVAQRLLRRVCSSCGAPHQPRAEELQRLGMDPKDLIGAEFRKGAGCAKCRHTGYKGRVAIFEMLVLDEMVRNAILARQMSQEIRMIAMESNGLTTLLEDGIVKAADGLTTLEELTRCLPRLSPPRPLPRLRRILGGLG